MLPHVLLPQAVVNLLTPLHAQLLGRVKARTHSSKDFCTPTAGQPYSVLDSLVRTILSQNTTDITSARAFASLKQALPTWSDVHAADAADIAAAIKVRLPRQQSAEQAGARAALLPHCPPCAPPACAVEAALMRRGKVQLSTCTDGPPASALHLAGHACPC